MPNSTVVETNADHELPVKTVFIPNGKSLDSIHEIKDLQPLQRVIGLVSNQGMFANNGYDEDCEEVEQSEKSKIFY